MDLSEVTLTKYNHLIHLFKEMQSVLIAYSGGVDSSLLLKVGTDTLKKNCIGVIGISPSLANQEYIEAIEQAKQINANIKTIPTNEILNSLYVLNNQDRCYFCKSELFDELNKLADELQINYIIEGSNFNDLDDFRPGMQAAKEKKIRSPLVEAKLTKTEIRELARYLGLSSWDKPSQPCLSSRVAYGLQINESILNKINQAEIFLKELNFQIVRVRYFEDHVSVEVGNNEVNRLMKPEIQNSVINKFKNIGFDKILFDAEGYQSGKLNKIHITQ
jgi:uncharacterized protein